MTIIDTELERTTEYTYNEFGFVKTILQKGNGKNLDALTQFTYDANGNVLTKIDAEGNLTEYLTHDIIGNVLKTKDQNGEIWEATYNSAAATHDIFQGVHS